MDLMEAHHARVEAYLRGHLEQEHGLAAERMKDLRELLRFSSGRETPGIAAMDDALTGEIRNRVTAGRAGPVFEPDTMVEMHSPFHAHPGAGSEPPPVGIVGRVVSMMSMENEDTAGMVVVRFPEGPLGYDGADELDPDDPNSGLRYAIPNTCLRAI
jgi:hypothetical protein